MSAAGVGMSALGVEGKPASAAEPSEPLLRVDNLFVHFTTGAGVVQAVSNVSFELFRGETLAVVGESGCGKSSLIRAIMGIEAILDGDVYFDGRPMPRDGAARRALSRDIQMIFQDPEASLNPRMTVGRAITEPLKLHQKLTARERRLALDELLMQVGLDPTLADRYPHELSGGQRQRVNIARALAVRPRVLILDEAVSALDVSIQAQILNLLQELQREFGLSYLFITHDLGVVRHLADRVSVMYLGEIVEEAPTEVLFTNPRHPYSQALLSAVPRLDPRAPRIKLKLKGDLPSALRPPTGCRFHTRCPEAFDRCPREAPAEVTLGAQHVRCFLVAPPEPGNEPRFEAAEPGNGRA
jgi:oligopeptide/dipeptide ABC transporter ATP-binding protein